MKTYGVIVRAWCEVVVEAPNPETAEELALKRADLLDFCKDKAEVECEYAEDGKVLAV